MTNENNPNLTEMSRDTLLYKICPWDRINGCCNGTRDYQCYDCAQLMNKWLDEYDKQIRAKAIDDFVQKVKEHQYVLSDVINSRDYGMFTVGIEQIAEWLNEGGK